MGEKYDHIIVGVVLTVAIAVLIYFVMPLDELFLAPEGSCSDTDFGLNYYVAGTARDIPDDISGSDEIPDSVPEGVSTGLGGGLSYEVFSGPVGGDFIKTDSLMLSPEDYVDYDDFCSGDVLTEYFCIEWDRVGSEEYTCLGECVDGACVAVCGDGFVETAGGEVCELGDTQDCFDSEGYEGLFECLGDCSGYSGECVSDLYCGDGEVNGTEECDSGGNVVECVPEYGNTCNYCNESCLFVEVAGEFCGDGTCNGPEDSSSCSEDCGSAGVNQDTGSPGHSKPKDDEENETDLNFTDTNFTNYESQGDLFENESCVSEWSCSDWGQCEVVQLAPGDNLFDEESFVEGLQTRECVDENQCGVVEDKPREMRECVVTDFDEGVLFSNLTGRDVLIYGVSVGIVVLIIVVLVVKIVLRKRARKHRN